jgi:arginyl-tRNA--protein-N-Asp/Glu arginylyltransferase
MKIFASEFGHSYETYSFAYTIYGERESTDTLSSLYDRGLLPYSGSKNSYDLFYMARSVRSDIRSWKPSSENRRVYKLFDGVFEKKEKTLEEIRHDERFFELCLSYFNLAHGSVMPRERLELILDTKLITKIIEHSMNGVPVAYILLVEDEEMSHYWFSFYQHEYAKTSLGMWLALDHIRDLQMTRKKYFYFGTCYATKALYKTNVEPLEYWDGKNWIPDVKKLKELCRSDEKRHIDNHLDIYKSTLDSF